MKKILVTALTTAMIISITACVDQAPVMGHLFQKNRTTLLINRQKQSKKKKQWLKLMKK